jgi:hypothetical protein
MAWTVIVGASAFAESASVDVPYYASPQANDIAIIWVATTSSRGIDWQAVSGWSPLTPVESGDHGGRVYWQRLVGGESGTVAIPIGDGDDLNAVMIGIRGATTTGTPFEDADTSLGSSASQTSPTIDTTIAATLGLRFGSSRDATLSSPPSGWTERVDVAGDVDVVIQVDSKELASAGTEPASTRTVSDNTWLVQTLAMLPESAEELTPTLYVDTDAFFTHTVAAGQALPPLLVDSDEFFSHIVDLQNRILEPTLFPSDDHFFVPLVQRESIAVPSVPMAATGSRSIFVIEIDAADENGDPVQLRYATEGFTTVESMTDGPAVHYDGRVIDPGNFEQHIFQPNRTFGEFSIGVGDVVIAAASAVRGGSTTDAVLEYAVDNRPIRIYELASKRDPRADWQLRFSGLVEYLVSDDAYNKLSFKIRDPLKDLDKPALTEAFTGTTTGGGQGTANGDASMAGIKKQRCYGFVSNVEAQCANPFDLVYLFSNGPVFSILAKDAGANLINIGDFPNLTALLGWTQVAGRYATCRALGLIRLGSTPTGAVTADVIVQNTSTERHLMTAASIVEQIIGERFEFDAAASAGIELLTGSPDQFSATGGTISGTGNPFTFTEDTATSEHYIESVSVAKDARPISYQVTAELQQGLRKFLFGLTSSNGGSGFAILDLDDETQPILGTQQSGGFSVTSSTVTDVGSGFFEVQLTITSDSAADVSVLLQLIDLIRAGEEFVFETVYLGTGDSIDYREMSLMLRAPLTNIATFATKNTETCYHVIRGDETVMQACSKVIGGIGGYLLPNIQGGIELGRFELPPEIPINLQNIFMSSPDSQWSTWEASLIGNHPSLIQENSVEEEHYVFAEFSKDPGKFKYQLTGEFASSFGGSPAVGRDLTIAIETALSHITALIALTIDGSVYESNIVVQSGNEAPTIDKIEITVLPDGYYSVNFEFTSDSSTNFTIKLMLTEIVLDNPEEPGEVFITTFYQGNGASGVLFRELEMRPINPSVLEINDEELVLADSLQRQATGDEGRGVPFWKVTGRGAKNWRVMKGTEVLPSVFTNFKAQLALEFFNSFTVSNETVRANHLSSRELVVDTSLVSIAAVQAETRRRAELYSAQRSAYRCTLPQQYAIDARPGTYITLVSERFGLANGGIFVVIGRIENFEDRTTTLILWG